MANQNYLILKATKGNASFKNMGGYSAVSLAAAQKDVQRFVDDKYNTKWTAGTYVFLTGSAFQTYNAYKTVKAKIQAAKKKTAGPTIAFFKRNFPKTKLGNREKAIIYAIGAKAKKAVDYGPGFYQITGGGNSFVFAYGAKFYDNWKIVG